MKRPGPVLQMQDVLLACGELNERERVAVQWVLDRANEEIGKRMTVEKAMDVYCKHNYRIFGIYIEPERFREELAAATNQATNE